MKRVLVRVGVGGLVVALGLFVLLRFTPIAFFTLVEAQSMWNRLHAGPDTQTARAGIARWFPRATGDAIHNAYFYPDPGWQDHPEWMQFETTDTSIVSEFIAHASHERPLRPDTVAPYGLAEGRGIPRWFHPPKVANGVRLLRDDANVYYLWVSADARKVWFIFFDH